MDADRATIIRDQVREAADGRRPLRVRGGDTKAFYGRATDGEPLDVSPHRGIVNYEPSELVITARAGTPLVQIEASLAESGQMLPFEPPYFAAGSTLGGAVAAGLGGPRRPWGGAPRDLVLGVKLVDGQGRVLRFGGQVMKNVAGYDLSRLMAGALGTLGVLLEISLKVLPRPPREQTLVLEMAADRALGFMRELAARPLPVTAATHHAGHLYLRLAGSDETLAAHHKAIGGERSLNGDTFWQRLRDHRLPFFDDPSPLWRLSLPPATRHPVVDGPTIIDWAGAQRWVKTAAAGSRVRSAAAESGGHAVLFRHGDRRGEVFHPLAPVLQTLHRRLKQVLDPQGVLNPGRLYGDW